VLLGIIALLAAVTMPAALRAESSMPQAPLANRQLTDPAKEAAAKDLMFSIRCLVCEGQSIADSDAEMAGDMRSLIRTRIQAGESPASIRTWLIDRYGSWISYQPPLDATTAPLWVAPVALMVIGLFLARGRFRKRS
jgi:cytochrome c-type biogenesis protein CcmH